MPSSLSPLSSSSDNNHNKREEEEKEEKKEEKISMSLHTFLSRMAECSGMYSSVSLFL